MLVSSGKAAVFQNGGFFYACEHAGAGHRASSAAGPSSRRFAVPSAATSCRTDRSGTAIQASPNCLSHPCDRLLAQRFRLSAANSPLQQRRRSGLRQSACVAVKTPRSFPAAHAEAGQQAGAAQGRAFRSAEQNEAARRARREAGERWGWNRDVPSPPVRQAGEWREGTA
jgi:hypothetical protein